MFFLDLFICFPWVSVTDEEKYYISYYKEHLNQENKNRKKTNWKSNFSGNSAHLKLLSLNKYVLIKFSSDHDNVFYMNDSTESY